MQETGTILLAGGSEFTGRMAIPDRQAIEMAGGNDAPIAVLPTAAAPDDNHRRAGQNGADWFHRLGANHVTVLPLIDPPSANDPAIAEALSLSRLIYLLGGFPRYLAQTLMASRSWQAIVAAYTAGAVIAGSSAGAMALCEYYYDPRAAKPRKGLGLVSGICVLPHHNTFGQTWAARAAQRLPKSVMVGIDEESAIILQASKGCGRVFGKGKATVYRSGDTVSVGPGKAFDLSILNVTVYQ